MDRCASICHCLAVFILIITTASALPINVRHETQKQIFPASSPFSTALETLQKQINYTFHRIYLLRRAMTHASFSEENNRALSVLGTSIIETSISLRYLIDDIDVSSQILNNKIAEISNVEACAADGMRLGLQKVVRVSPKTNSTTPAIVCGAFRAIFGAIAIDTGKSDDAGDVYWNVHSRNGAMGVAL